MFCGLVRIGRHDHPNLTLLSNTQAAVDTTPLKAAWDNPRAELLGYIVCLVASLYSCMMAGFAMAQAQLAALFMQSIAYGVHMVTFAACMYSWFRRPSGSRSSIRWMVVAVAFFVIGTCDVSFNLYHNILAFIDYKGRGGANEEFQDASSWVNVLRVCRSKDLLIQLTDVVCMPERVVLPQCRAFRRRLGKVKSHWNILPTHWRVTLDIPLLDRLRQLPTPSDDCRSTSSALACMRNLRHHDCVLPIYSACRPTDTRDTRAATILVYVLHHNPFAQFVHYW